MTLGAEKRLVYEDRVQVPRLYIQWPTVGEKHDDHFALDVLGTILSGARTARITKALVYDEQAAASVQAGQSTNEDVGEFILIITPRPGHTLTSLEAASDAIIERLKKEGPTAEEIQKAIAGEELGFVSNLESNLGKAFQLADGAGYHGDAGYFRTAYKKTLSVTAEDVKRVANKYLTERTRRAQRRAGRQAGSGREARTEQAGDRLRRQETGRWQMRGWIAFAVLLLLTAAPSAQQALDRKKVPPPGKTPELRVPAWTKSTLANGAELIVSEKHDLPLISFSITFLGGADQFEPAGKQSVASLTAALLSEGTKTRDAEALSNALQLLGTSVNASVAGESGSISFRSTTAKFPATLDILADMLVNPTFPENGLERLRGQRLVQLTQARAQPGAIANRVFPAHRLRLRASLRARGHRGIAEGRHACRPRRVSQGATTSRDARWSPSSAIRRRRAVKPVIEKALAAWTKGGEKPSFTFPPVAEPKATTIFLVDKPGAAQSTFAIGRPGPPRNTPDYYAIQVMNTMLGGMFQSRLNANIREEKGYSYGVSSSFGYGKGPGSVQDRRRHRHREERCGARRVHEGAARHPRRPADHGRRAERGEGRADPAPARHVRVGQQHQLGADEPVGRRTCRTTTTSNTRSGSPRSPGTMSCGWRSST